MQPYVPPPLPITDLDYRRLIGLVGRANAALAHYNGLLQGIVNPAVLLSPMTTQEAVLSSRIEGTQATLDEVLQMQAGLPVPDQQKEQDIREIVNYREAVSLAARVLPRQPISLSQLCDLHKVLLGSVRGQDKAPGCFRKDQNWIGSLGCSVEDATFVPPGPLQLLDHLQAWEKYVQAEDFDPLVQLAVMHAQFEMIHPFKDGNGRIGRMLVTLFLYQRGLLSSPNFYLSAYLQAHRDAYYAKLEAVSQQRDWDGWIEFFLQAVEAQSQDNASKVKQVMDLYEVMKDRILKLTHSEHAVRILDAIFDKPLFTASDLASRSGIPKPTAMTLVSKLKEAQILRVLRKSSGRQAAILAFGKLVNLVEGREIF